MKNRFLFLTAILVFGGSRVCAGRIALSCFDKINKVNDALHSHADKQCTEEKVCSFYLDAYVERIFIEKYFSQLRGFRTEKQLIQMIKEFKSYESIYGAKVQSYGLDKNSLRANL